MSNALFKDTQLVYSAGTLGIAGSPGSPYVPAYTTFEDRQVCNFTAGSGGHYEYVQNEQGVWVPVFIPDVSGATTSGSYVCTMQRVPVYHPAQPAIAPVAGTPPTAAQTAYNFNLGWNAGARSNGFVLNDGYASFKVPYSLTGGVLGLNGEDMGASYPEIDHAIYLSGKTARVYEQGVQVAYLGPYADADVFKIARRAGVVTYLKNGTLAYTSAVSSVGAFFLDSSLYAGGDYVYDPVIAGFNGSAPGTGGTLPAGTTAGMLNATMMPLEGIGGDVAFAQANSVMLPLAGGRIASDGSVSSGGMLSRGAGSMLPLAGLGSAKHTELIVWPPGVYPVSGSGAVTGIVTGGLLGEILTGGSFAGNLYAPDGTLIGSVQATSTGTDPGSGFNGEYIGVIKDPVTGEVIGYVAGDLSGIGAGTTSYAANVTGSAYYVLLPTDGTSVTVTGDITGTAGADGTINGTYTGVLTNPVTGEVTGIVTATVTGVVNPDGTISAIYTGVVTDPVTGAVIGIIVGAVTGTGTLTQNPDGSSSFDAPGVVSTGTYLPTAPPTTIVVTTYGESHGVLQPMASSGGAVLPPPAYALGAGALGVLLGAGISLTGEIGGGATALLPLVGGISSDHAYGESRGVMLPMRGYGSAYEGNLKGSIGNIGVTLASMETQRILVVVMTSSGTVSSVMTLGVAIDATMHSDVTATASMSFTALLAAIMQTNVSVGATVPPFEADHVVYVVNTDSKATSTYEDYPFNSYALFDGAYFGVKSDGLYRLDGDDDDGASIQASVSVGKQNFGSLLFKKRMTAAYVGVSSTGVMVLKITKPDGTEHLYSARRSDDHLTTQRIDVGRGIEASYLTFELFNQDGADFELASVEFQAAEMKRRI